MQKKLTITSKEITPIEKKISSLVISDQTSLKVATELLSQANSFLDRVIEEKEKVTKPLNEALKAERARFKPLEASLDAIIASIRGKMSIYQTALVKSQKEAEAELAKSLESGDINIEDGIAIIPEEISKKTETDFGSVQFIEQKKFEVVDLAELPIQYHLANETAIRKAMLAGEELKGVKYWTEMVPRNNRL